ncbi:hypothetical protein BY996DRAFT_6530729 [Phakopsora pachyrhizi]|nr:hypothetical protein BY996DRAFT_6530729 [Phakopsora pachyrhizi]
MKLVGAVCYCSSVNNLAGSGWGAKLQRLQVGITEGWCKFKSDPGLRASGAILEAGDKLKKKSIINHTGIKNKPLG